MTRQPTLTLRHPLPDVTEFVMSPTKPSLLGWRLARAGVLVGVLAWAAHQDNLRNLWARGVGHAWAHQTSSSVLTALGIFALVAYCLTEKQLVSESITPLPSLGLVLSTTHARLLPFLQHTTRQTVIPLDEIIDVCINEGLRRWAVVGFLCVLRRGSEKTVVVFPETMPKTTMLLEVYHGVREILWDEYDDNSETETTRVPNGTDISQVPR